MARALENVNLLTLSAAIKGAREAKGWTLQQLSHELWSMGFPTSQNKLWRLENTPPRRVDTELLLWLEKVLEVPLLDGGEPKPVLVDDVLDLVEQFVAARRQCREPPPQPASQALGKIYHKLRELVDPT